MRSAARSAHARCVGPNSDAGPLRAMKKPPVAVGGAGLMVLATLGLFLTVLGDPRAGAPSARVDL